MRLRIKTITFILRDSSSIRRENQGFSQGHPVHAREERTILHSPRWPFMGGVPLDRTHGVTG